MDNILTLIKEEFNIEGIEVMTLSPLVLAYIGDSVYDTVIRTIVVAKGNRQVKKLHQNTKQYVSAVGQVKILNSIKDDLTEEELAIFKRGRNAKSNTRAKNASITDYRNATGFEALIGYLYLKKEHKRMLALIHKGIGHE